MLLDMPYYMENEDWYYSVPDKECPWLQKDYLTELGKSIPEVVKSYEDYQKQRISNNYNLQSTTDDLLQGAIEVIRERGKKAGKTDEEIEKEIEELLKLED
ncbi:MAG: hypothetical protein IJ371_00010 [Clostridia bacterium]|nr:hypothetical protein [Clostridia bacterium]